MNFKIVPLSKRYVERIKSTGRDDFGNEIVTQPASGYGPCRMSLKPFVPNVDHRMLISHTPFEIANAFNQPGPVFINTADVDEYRDVHRFPSEIKGDKTNFPLTLIGYDKHQHMIFAELVGDRDVDEMTTRVFAERADVDVLHARNAEAGCFICKIVRG